MKKLEYTVEFVTPAFLGNAEQSAQWRTPPFKTMLRQWWRVLNANLSEAEMRKKEGILFGKALDGDSHQSKIRIRLQPLSSGTQSPWTLQTTKPIERPNLEQVYLGFGPITNGAVRNAIPIEHKANLVLILDNDVNEEEIHQTLWLCNQFATLGSRCKNGWGSISISGINLSDKHREITPYKQIKDALSKNWAHGVGIDNNGKSLIWKTSAKSTWHELIRDFYRIRKERINKAVAADERPIISYPVTKNNAFGSNYRLPSQFLFKVRREGEKLTGYVVHMPHQLPNQNISESQLISIWEKIHKSLDASSSGLGRIEMVGDKQ